MTAEKKYILAKGRWIFKPYGIVMSPKERLLTAASFREPDRVPIELNFGQRAKELPETQKLVDFIETAADNFIHVPAVEWGFFGLPSCYSEEIIEDVPNEFRRIRQTHKTQVGDFSAITRHFYPNVDSGDFHWERRFVDNLDEMERLAGAPRTVCPILLEKHYEAVQHLGDRGLPIMGLFHPLGSLVRKANMEEVYIWLQVEPAIMHRFLESANAQVRHTLFALHKAGITGWFVTYAHEMLIPPWMGRRQFDEVVFPYDKMVNDAIHKIGGRNRSHCHGNSMQFLERMSEMGVDAIEPLEPPPFGDVDLGEAKHRIGDKMLLSGNVPSQDFLRMSRIEVKQWVRKSIADAAKGGGFTLRTTGGQAGLDVDLEREQIHKIIENIEAYIEAGMEYGAYPIHSFKTG